jgi:hypothetical protein
VWTVVAPATGVGEVAEVPVEDFVEGFVDGFTAVFPANAMGWAREVTVSVPGT